MEYTGGNISVCCVLCIFQSDSEMVVRQDMPIF